MKYSIIVPCYNAAKTLKKTINSIQKSGLIDFEILLIDDGSRDDTPALCDRLAAEYENIRVIHQSNAGVSSARNKGLAEARGDYIWFFDSDDLVDADNMKRAVQIVEEYKPDMLIFGMSFDYYAGKRMYQRLELFYDVEGEMHPEEWDTVFSELYRNNSLTSSCNKLFKRTLLCENGIEFNCKLFILEDFLFVLEALEHCETIYNFPKVIYRYVQAGDETTNHAAVRLARVEDLALYLKPFERILAKHPDVLTGLFYMLLWQKISIQSVEEMAETTRNNCNNDYTSGKYAGFASSSDRNLIGYLKNGEWETLIRNRKKSHMRHMIANFVKKNPIYKLLKGTNVRRIKW